MPSDALNSAVDEIVDDMPKKKFSGKKIVLLVLLPLLLVAGGGAALYFSGILDQFLNPETPDGEEMMAEEEPSFDFDEPGLFIEIPELTVNLNTSDRRASFLRIRLSIEVADPVDEPVVAQLMPRIVDSFQVYMRELRVEDLQGSAGSYRLREELLRRVNAAAAPARIREVLVNEMLVQ